MTMYSSKVYTVEMAFLDFLNHFRKHKKNRLKWHKFVINRKENNTC